MFYRSLFNRHNITFHYMLPILLLGSLSNNKFNSFSANSHTPSSSPSSNTVINNLTNHIKLLNEYNQAIEENEENPIFTFPNKKYYELRGRHYDIKYDSNCSLMTSTYKMLCSVSDSFSYEDFVISTNPRIMINSIKGVDHNDNQYVKFKPDNLNYDDWTTKSIEENSDYKVNWKEQYGYFRKNILSDTNLYFSNKDKKPFTSERYSLYVERSHNFGKYIPMFTGFSNGRDDMKDKLGFEEYDEVNIPYQQLLERNNLRTLPPDVFANNKNIDFYNRTKYNYGWYNRSELSNYRSYDQYTQSLDKIYLSYSSFYDKKPREHFGSPYVSFQTKTYSPNTFTLYTPIPLSFSNHAHELKSTTTNDNGRPLSDWEGKDLFHVNYDRLVSVHKPLFSSNGKHIHIPFSLNFNEIKNLNVDLKEFFKISSYFNFYLNFTYKGEDFRSSPYTIRDLIENNSIFVSIDNNKSDPFVPNSKIEDLFLSIEPIDKERVHLIQAGYPKWEFSLSGQDSVNYSLKKDNILDSIGLDVFSKIGLDENQLPKFFPSQLNYHKYLGQLLNINNQGNSLISPADTQSTVQPIIEPDDLNGNLKISYYDPSTDQRITKKFTNMMRLESVDQLGFSAIPNSHMPNKSIRHSSYQSLSNEYTLNPLYLMTNKYFNDNVKIIPIDKDENDFPVTYKVEITGLNYFPQIKKQWQDTYQNQIFTTDSKFSVAPLQKERYTLNTPDYYLNNNHAIWNELLVFTPLAKSADLSKDDFDIKAVKEDYSNLTLIVSLKNEDDIKPVTYNFQYDPIKVKNGHILDPDNPFLLQNAIRSNLYDVLDEDNRQSIFSENIKLVLILSVSFITIGLVVYCIISLTKKRTK